MTKPKYTPTTIPGGITNGDSQAVTSAFAADGSFTAGGKVATAAATAAANAKLNEKIYTLKKTWQRTVVDFKAAYTAQDNAKYALDAIRTQSNSIKLTAWQQTGNYITFTYSSLWGTVSGVGAMLYVHDTTGIGPNIGIYKVGNNITSKTSTTISIYTQTSATVASTPISGVAYTGLANVIYQIKNTWDNYDRAVTAYNQAKATEVDAFNKLNKISPVYGTDPTKTPTSGGGGGGGATTPQIPVTIQADNGPVTYNIPSVKSAYFYSAPTYTNSILLGNGGSPASAGLVTKASELWQDLSTQGAHRGMFQTYTYWKMKATKSNTGTKDPNLPAWYLDSSYQTDKYGFQFLYNPGSVSMTWDGTPVVDPGLMMSGKDVTPYITPSQSASTISFDLIINRMPDYAAINKLGVDGVIANEREIYGSGIPASDFRDDLTLIQELGTMYDIEFLLSTLVGFRAYSALRHRYTADIGFLLGIPVELHLGKDLRYLGTIGAFTVNHTIFGKGMVPLFTNVNITFNRRVEPTDASTNKVNGGSMVPQYGLSSTTAGTPSLHGRQN